MHVSNLSLEERSHTAQVAPRRPKWLFLFFGIALFDLLTVCISLFLSHRMMLIYDESVEVNKKWAVRLGMFEQLSTLTTDVNAPGNDVFDSHDVPGESAKALAARAILDASVAKVQAELQTEPNQSIRLDLQRKLEDMVRAVDEMQAESTLIFAYFSKGQADAAGKRMATMDRKFAQVHAALARISDSARAVQRQHFDDQVQAAENLRYLELIIAGCICIMVAAAMLYGHRVWRQIETFSRERELFITELDRAKLAAETASVAKSQFLANMSHEIRTPMNGVLGMTEILLGTKLDSEQRRFTETIHRSGEALLGVINDILDFSKIESGHLELEEAPLDVGAILEEVCELLAPTVHKHGVELICYVGHQVPRCVKGDAMRLRQIFINLIGNAAKFTRQGEILVRLEAQRLEPMHEEEPQVQERKVQLRLSVQDTGVGIAQEHQSRIFEAFAQADSSTSRKHGGTGLGLAITQRMVQRMGGSVSLRSELDKGSTFVAEFVLQEMQTPRAIAAEVVLRGRNVLFVDDNDTNREVIQQQLKPYGVSVVLASDAQDGLAQARARHDALDAVLLDVQMPEVDGIELARRLRDDPLTRQLPVIILSSVTRALSNQELDELRIRRWMNKPARIKELVHALVSILDKDTVDESARRPSRHSEARTPIGGHILLAEDNLVNQHVAHAMLKKLGCKVTVANNGLAVLRELATGRFDAILMDCQMPEMDGFEATLAVRQRENNDKVSEAARLPIIALTANAMPEDRQRCMAVGMNDYLSKPFSSQQLESVLRRNLRNTPVDAGETARMV